MIQPDNLFEYGPLGAVAFVVLTIIGWFIKGAFKDRDLHILELKNDKAQLVGIIKENTHAITNCTHAIEKNNSMIERLLLTRDYNAGS